MSGQDQDKIKIHGQDQDKITTWERASPPTKLCQDSSVACCKNAYLKIFVVIPKEELVGQGPTGPGPTD